MFQITKEKIPEIQIENALAKVLVKEDLFKLIDQKEMTNIFKQKGKNIEQSVYTYQDLTVCNFEQCFTYGFD